MVPVAEKWLYCNGYHYVKLVRAGLVWLEEHHQHVNALNVFPVPDGDTGTNMLLTMRSAHNRVKGSAEAHIGRVAQEVSQGALMGARGNSGVILSQIWRGLARGLEGKETCSAKDLAHALKLAADTAYSGVMKPVEGTLLTVIREVSDEAGDAAHKSNDLRFMLERILERAQQALERTPEMLPVLKQAGVVDSGGQGLVYILQGMARHVNGLPVGEANVDAAAGYSLPAQALAVPEGGSLENPYDVQFIIRGKGLRVADVRAHIDTMGDSTVVVGDESTIKVHVHVKDPGMPLSYGIGLGQILDVVVENMQQQMEDIVGAPPLEAPAVTIEPGQVGVVAVAPGEGLSRAFRDLGAAFVVNGGQTSNPSTEELFQAIQDVPTDKVIVLPNNKNIVMAAETASELSAKQVAVVPTQTIPQGIAALFAYHPDGDMDVMAAAMAEAATEVASGEITTATRTVLLNGVQVQEGDVIGLADGVICAAGDSWSDVLEHTLKQMGVAGRELVSLYYGQEVTGEQAQALAEEIESLYPEVEVEIVPGGQAFYYFILGAE